MSSGGTAGLWEMAGFTSKSVTSDGARLLLGSQRRWTGTSRDRTTGPARGSGRAASGSTTGSLAGRGRMPMRPRPSRPARTPSGSPGSRRGSARSWPDEEPARRLLDRVVDLEHRQVHRDDDEPHDGADHDDHHRLEDRGERLDGCLHLLLVEV